MTGLDLDRTSGRATITIVRPVVLRPPAAAVWAGLVDELAVLDPGDPFDGDSAVLNAAVLSAGGHPPLGDPERWPVWLHDPAVARLLLEHWRDWPLSPFVTRDRGDTPPASDPTMSPGTRALASLYRACRGTLTPGQVDRLPLWKIAALAAPDESDEPAHRPTVKVGRATIEMRRDGLPAYKRFSRDPKAGFRYGGRDGFRAGWTTPAATIRRGRRRAPVA